MAKCGSGVSHSGNPAVSQYVEKVPTACGSKGARQHTGSTAPVVNTLPTQVIKRLSKTSQGRLLNKASSSSQYGAPPVARAHREPISSQVHGPSALGASVSAVSGGSSGGLIALLVIMAVVALAVAGAAVYRRRV
jgi:Asp-tRNA(Asn)/Glu-tRNA(Gln) amidotransferase A subunit family amidase